MNRATPEAGTHAGPEVALAASSAAAACATRDRAASDSTLTGVNPHSDHSSAAALSQNRAVSATMRVLRAGTALSLPAPGRAGRATANRPRAASDPTVARTAEWSTAWPRRSSAAASSTAWKSRSRADLPGTDPVSATRRAVAASPHTPGGAPDQALAAGPAADPSGWRSVASAVAALALAWDAARRRGAGRSMAGAAEPAADRAALPRPTRALSR
mmetsp:Transcript_18152/g.68668  ORF Transcript_18152/g.68668 Transcript_18152/m.68668 type:complete len:216 (+) Transcript_18152:4008-4655(+)